MRSHYFGAGVSMFAAQLCFKIMCCTHTHRTTLLNPLRASQFSHLTLTLLCPVLSSQLLHSPIHNSSSQVTMVATAPVLEGDMLESSSPSDILFWLVSHVLLLDIFLRDVMLGFTACRQQRWGLFVLYSTLFRSVVSLIWCYHLIFIGSDSSYVCSSFTPLLILIPSDPPVLSSSLLRSTLASRDSCLPRDWKPSLT